MNRKTAFLMIGVASAACVLLAGCRDEATSPLTGSYVYKTAGQVRALPTVLTGDSVDAVAACSALSGYDLANLWAPLMPESGEMKVVYTGQAKDSVILTFTALLGDLCTLRGTFEGDTLTLEGTDRKSVQVTDGTGPAGGGFVTVGGTGRRYNGALILDLCYRGTLTTSVTGRPTEMTITDSRIQCVAQTLPSLGLNVYAYKTGGQVRLMPTVLADSTATAVDACSALCGYNLHDLWLPLKPESGALNIVEAEGGALLLSFNALLGDAFTLAATAADGTLTLSDGGRKTMQLTDGQQSLGGGTVEVAGRGCRTDDLLLIDLDYRGTFVTTVTGSPVEMTILESRVQCSASRN